MLRYPDGRSQKFRVRSLVGLIPLFAVERLELEWIEPFKEFTANLDWFLKNRRDLVERRGPHRRATTARRRYVLTIVEPGPAPPAARRASATEREFLSRLRHPQPVEAARGAAVRVRRRGASATSRPSRPRSSRAATRTGAGRSGSRRRFLLIESLRKLGKAFGPRYRVDDAGLGRSADRASRRWRAISPTG